MRIRKHRPPVRRAEPVKFGQGSSGKRKLVQAAMEKGFSQRRAEKAVNAMVECWKRALLARDPHVEMPIGFLKVKKTPKH